MVTYEEVVEAFGKIVEFCSERDCNECKLDINKHPYCEIANVVGGSIDLPEIWDLGYLISKK